MTEPNDLTPPDDEFEEAARLAEEALGHARRHRSPPRPNVYEVWYNYAAGGDKALRARVDAASREGVVNLDAIEQIYEEHFLQQRLAQDMSRIGDELDSGLQDALGLLGDGLGSNRAYLAALKKAQDQIGKISRNHDAKRVVMQLLQLGRDHAEQTESVAGELARARVQVAEMKRELRRLRDSAYLDHLTQIANRRHMDEVLQREIAEARRHHAPLCFALGDLDHFKELNDRCGHQVGDALLKHFAALLRSNIKGQDTAARFGGEEFAIIFPRTSLFGAGHITDRIRQLLRGTDFVLSRDQSRVGPVSVSFGVTQLRPGDNMDSLIRRADGLLYAAKQKGRNRVETDM
jgi:diguanylate cyclase